MNNTKTLKSINAIVKAAHPDWTNTQIYEETGKLYKAGFQLSIKDNTTDIVMRKDKEAYGEKVLHAVLFCKHCDPKAEGGHGGIIYSTECFIDDAVEQAKKHQNYCPTCGRKINWGNPIETTWGRWN